MKRGKMINYEEKCTVIEPITKPLLMQFTYFNVSVLYVPRL